MGDRANIKVLTPTREDPKSGVCMYSHWGGYRLPRVLANALDRGKSRWGDELYLARVVFSELVKGDIDGETGYGLSTYLGDGDDRVLTVDPIGQTVSTTNTDGDSDWPENGSVLSFPAFITLYKGA
jgi:hypothetical protein